MILASHGIIGSSGVTVPLLLDTYSGASAAYSLRKLRTAYTGYAIRVRRSSDNTSQDIGFDANGNLDTTAITSFVGAGNGFVSIWYDQSGNNNHANQVTQANQPQIISSGNLQLVNSKPSLYFNATNQSHLVLTTSLIAEVSNFNTFVGKRANANDKLIGLGGTASSACYGFVLWSDNNYYLQAQYTAYQYSNNTDLTNNQVLLTGMNASGTMSISKNGTILSSTSVALSYIPSIGGIGKQNVSNYTLGHLQEIVYYNSDKSTNKTGIESNINTYYSIY